MAAVMDETYRDINSSSDLENWMAKLPEQLHSVPINYLTIPGKSRYLKMPHDTALTKSKYFLSWRA